MAQIFCEVPRYCNLRSQGLQEKSRFLLTGVAKLLQLGDASLKLRAAERIRRHHVDPVMSQLGPALALLFAAAVFIVPLWLGTPPDLGS